jgi:hypothetical protein
MKQMCKKSGILISADTTLLSLCNLTTVRKKLLTVSTHPIFTYHLGDILKLATAKPYEKLTLAQRHLLLIAMIDKLGCIDIRYPITKDSILSKSQVLNLFPKLIEACMRINTRPGKWRQILEETPKMEVRTDNFYQLPLYSFIKEEVIPNTLLLVELAGSSATVRTSKDKLEDEIELERQLKRTISEHRTIREKYLFKPHMGKLVLELLNRDVLAATGKALSDKYIENAMHIFTTKPEKIRCPSAILPLRKTIVSLLPKEQSPDYELERAYTALAVGYLDTTLEHYNNMSRLFGVEPTRIQAQLPNHYPIAYTTSEIRQSPFQSAEKRIEPKNPNIGATTNPFLQKLLAKRAAMEQGVNNDGK